MKITLNLPNQLTLGRLGLCVVFVIVLSIDWGYPGTAALLVFIVASLTDWLDGWLARQSNQVTDLGRLLDPLADKILISAAFVGLMNVNMDGFDNPPMWMVVVVIAREFLITGLRLVASNRGYVMSADWAGKHKTIFQMIYVSVSLVLLSGLELELNKLGFFQVPKFLQPILLWIALILTLTSGFWYFFKNRDLFAVEMEEDPELPPVLVPPPVTSVSRDAQVQTPHIASTYPGFKEWQIVVESLGRGEQTLILRKGGIAEGREGFQVKHQQFWLFPTRFHQQVAKTKSAVIPSASELTEESPVSLEFFARVEEVHYLEDWTKVQAIDPFHIWKEEVIRERFDYGEEKGLHCIILRIYRHSAPVLLPWKKEYGGCRSWVEVTPDFAEGVSVPVLNEESFQLLTQQIHAALV